MIEKIYLCRECGHVQETPSGMECGEGDYLTNCDACQAVESLDLYVKTGRMRFKYWTDELAAKRAKAKERKL